ncbi:site-specific integrase [Patescibacteria group bacterium]|nr:site-specific integrase [Patescibacteria group bacterium]
MKDLIKSFENYLLNSIKISKKSLKHYRSDLSHFVGWLFLKIKTLGILADDFNQAIPFLSHNLLKEYKSFLVLNKVALKTVNRRLSTLRHFSKYLILNDLLQFDFMDNIQNIKKQESNLVQDHLTKKFSKFLESQKVSHSTSKNYIADINQFISWINNQKKLTAN